MVLVIVVLSVVDVYVELVEREICRVCVVGVLSVNV